MTEYEKRRTRGEIQKTAEKGLGVEGTLQIISSLRSSKRRGEENRSKKGQGNNLSGRKTVERGRGALIYSRYVCRLV